MNTERKMVRCGDCKYFVRDGNCGYLATPAGRAKDRPFERAPFWVWSDCYSDKEQVRADVDSACVVFAAKENLVVTQMTMEEAIELGKTDSEANWDNPVRLMAYRIRTGLTPTPENPNG